MAMRGTHSKAKQSGSNPPRGVPSAAWDKPTEGGRPQVECSAAGGGGPRGSRAPPAISVSIC